MKLSRSAVAGSVLALSITGCSGVETLNPLQDDDGKSEVKYTKADYDSFNTEMRAGKMGLKAYRRANLAAEWGGLESEDLAHLKVGVPHRVLLRMASLTLTPESKDGGSAMTISREGSNGNLSLFTAMNVTFENSSADYFGETAEREEVRAFFNDPDTRVSKADYDFDGVAENGHLYEMCDWEAEFTDTSGEVISKTEDCTVPPTSLPNLASFTDRVL